MIRSVASSLLALLALALPAGALFEDHFDPFGDLLADRLASLPETGGTKVEAKRRKALLKARAALALPSGDRAGDLALGKKAAAAVQKTFADDAVLLAALAEALDAYRDEADGEVLTCDGLLAGFPEGRTATNLGKKLLGIGNLLAKEETATTPSARAATLRRVFQKLVPVKEALGDGPPVGPCPPPGVYSVNSGTVTALVGGEPWSSTDLEVILVVDEDTLAILQLGLIARRPDGTGGTLDRIDFTFDSGDYAGPDTYTFDTTTPYILGMNYAPPGPGSIYQALSGTVTVSEFAFTPSLADPTIAGGRLVGTFAFNGCTLYDPSGTCTGPALPITVTEGTFAVCNFSVIYY